MAANRSRPCPPTKRGDMTDTIATQLHHTPPPLSFPKTAIYLTSKIKDKRRKHKCSWNLISSSSSGKHKVFFSSSSVLLPPHTCGKTSTTTNTAIERYIQHNTVLNIQLPSLLVRQRIREEQVVRAEEKRGTSLFFLAHGRLRPL